jgi:hypothetical protein
MKAQLHGALIAALLVFSTSNGTAAVIFTDDFESYQVGTNLVGQGGWIGSSGGMRISTSNSLPTQVVNGLARLTSSQEFAFHSIGNLSSTEQTSMRFNAAATTNTANSWAGLSSNAISIGTFVVWTFDSSYGGWGLEIRSPGQTFQSFATRGGAGLAAVLAIHADPIGGRVWGEYDLGSGLLQTPVFSIPSSALLAMNGIHIGQDFRAPAGIQVDNIVIATSVPESSSLILLALGLVTLVVVTGVRQPSAA